MINLRHRKPNNRGVYGDFVRLTDVSRKLCLRMNSLACGALTDSRKARLAKYAMWQYDAICELGQLAITMSKREHLSLYNQTKTEFQNVGTQPEARSAN